MVANELHLNLDLKFMKWEDAIKEINNGNADVLMTCDYSDSFEGVDKLLKSEPVSSDEFIVYSKHKIQTSNVLYGKKIGIMKNGNVLSEIEKMQLKKYCIEYPDNRQTMLALMNDEVEYAIMRQTVGTVLQRELHTHNIEGYISIGQSKMCFGISGKNPLLINQINNTLENLKVNGKMDKLRDKWLTTFIRPYTVPEIFSKNTWVDLILIFFIFATFTIYVRETVHKKIIDEENFRSTQVVQWLTQDFICVNYIEITDSPKKDPVINFRVSEMLMELIPGWEEEKRFSYKLDLLRDHLVYEPDRKQFDENTRRIKVLKELEDNGVYYVNTRAFINNDICYYQMKFSAVYSEGFIKGIVAGFHSVDEQIKNEMEYQKKLQEALRNAQVASRAKTEFLFNMSHDIRTPLNAITGFTNMAIKHIDEKEKALDYLKKTQQSGSLLTSLINGVLDVSRIESGKATVEKQKGDVLLSFVNIESTMKELAADNNVELSFEFKNINDRYVYWDFNRCIRVFVNIISNAIKYNKKGGYVKVKCEQLGEAKDGFGTYCYTFEDNGIGMTDEFQQHVFEKFSRENNSNLNKVQGTGLGMAVCKSFVELMGGIIECSSKINEGTIFKVILPFQLQSEKVYTDIIKGVEINTDEKIVFDRNIFNGKKVLVADDSKMNLEIAEDILKDEKLIVETAEDGNEVLDLLEKKGPDYYDFILMDIRMPVMDGYSTTRKIRQLYPESKIPIIALSANAFEEDRADSLAAGMDGHVAKPINTDILFGVLAQIITK